MSPSLLLLAWVPLGWGGPTSTGGKVVREAGDEFPNVATSTNFAVKWGAAGNFSEEEAAALLGYFERAWDVEVVDMGLLPPAVCDEYKFNVYVADTGAPSPASEGASGYLYFDSEGLPAVAIHPSAVAEGYADVTSAHEFFHAVQDGLLQYRAVEEAEWYWEATAMWIQGEVHPDDPDESTYVHTVALATGLPLWEPGSSPRETLADFHPYGAFLFPRFLTEWVADRTLIVDSWMDSRAAPSPQTTLGFLLEERGIEIASAYADYAAHNAVWDYPDGDEYRAVVEASREAWAADPDFEEAFAILDGAGTVVSPSGPEGGGYQLVRQVAPPPGAWEWSFEGDPGVPWGVRVVRDRPSGPEYLTPELVDGSAVIAFEGDGTDVWLAVSAWTAQPLSGGWSLTVAGGAADSGDPTDTGEPDPPGRCGCGGSRSFAPSALLLALLAVALRRVPG